MVASSPKIATTMPASVDTVALETPAAMERGLLEPVAARASNTSSMPITVPSRPSSGHTLISAPISEKCRVSCRAICPVSSLRYCSANQDR